jgi:hypothetical protein
MYFQGTLSIDPSHMTLIESVKPTKAFGKMLYFMSMGLASEREERETFTAVSILQKLNRVFVSLGITNVVRLAKDDVDYYLDREGKEDDLKEAMAAFEQKSSSSGQSPFNTLRLVLEHEDEDLKYLIEINIQRAHKVGEHPIRVVVNGLMKDLRVDADQGDQEAKKLLSAHFDSQTSYDSYTGQKKANFDAFLDRIDEGIRGQIGVDDVRKSSKSRIIRPSKPVKKQSEWSRHDDYDPLYYGYYGYDNYFFYSWVWSDMCYRENIHCHDCSVVDEAGQTVFDVGEQGFNAGESNVLNPEEPMVLPPDADVAVHADNAYSDSLCEAEQAATAESAAESVAEPTGGGDSGGWLGSFFGGDSDSGGDGGSDSSCGGSSCGGGCGGD